MSKRVVEIAHLEGARTGTVAGCLRNAQAVAEYLNLLRGRKLIIAAGERWPKDDSLRPAIEDIAGAGAIISELRGSKSPEAMTAESIWFVMRGTVKKSLRDCASGRELAEKGFDQDVDITTEVNSSVVVPVLATRGFFFAQSVIEQEQA